MLVTLNELKTYLKIPLATTDYDAFLNQQNAIVSEAIETYCKRKFLTGTYVQTFYVEDFKNNSMVSDLWLSQFPVQSITHVKSISESGIATTLTDYRIKKDSGKLVRENYKCWFEEFDALVTSIDLSNYNHAISEEASLERQTSQQLFGQEISGMLINRMGARNLDLSKAGTQIDVISLSKDNAAIKLLIETGALTTALGAIAQVRTDYPHHDDIYEWTHNLIYEFLTSRGYL